MAIFRQLAVFTLQLLTAVPHVTLNSLDPDENVQCQVITIPMCQHMGYNVTAMPNAFLHDTQEEAGLEVHQYWPLVELRCSEDLQFFLCASYAPVCVPELHRTLPVCRQVCERARAGCEPLMHSHNFQWPERLDCARLPKYGDPRRLCMDNRNGDRDERMTESVTDYISGKSEGNMEHNETTCPCECEENKMQQKAMTSRRPDNRFSASCRKSCRGGVFSNKEKQWASMWIKRCVVVCGICSLLAMTTFMLDRSRCPYPQRPVICMTFCYLLTTVGYGLNAALAGQRAWTECGETVTQNSAQQSTWTSTDRAATETDIQQREQELEGSSDPQCLAEFALTYGATTAASVWWCLLALCWFASGALKWGNEVIAGHAILLHSIGWGISSLTTISVLSASSPLKRDPLLGLCQLGEVRASDGRHRRLLLQLVPQLACLILGALLLMAGFAALRRVRRTVGDDKHRLQRLMLRLACFSTIYASTTAVSVGIDGYLILHGQPPQELSTAVCSCQIQRINNWAVSTFFGIRLGLLEFSLLRHMAAVVPGLGCLAWTLSTKAALTWRHFCCRRRPHHRSVALSSTAGMAASQMTPPQWHHLTTTEAGSRGGTKYGSHVTGSLLTSRTNSEAAATGSSRSMARSRNAAVCHV